MPKIYNVIDYTGDLVTVQKSGEEIWQDVSGAGKAYAKPFMDLKGEDNRTMLTLTEQESYVAGLKRCWCYDASRGYGNGCSWWSIPGQKWCQSAQGWWQKSGHADGDGAKGGVPHGNGDGPDGTSGGAMKDGKLKTNAALMPSSLRDWGNESTRLWVK